MVLAFSMRCMGFDPVEGTARGAGKEPILEFFQVAWGSTPLRVLQGLTIRAIATLNDVAWGSTPLRVLRVRQDKCAKRQPDIVAWGSTPLRVLQECWFLAQQWHGLLHGVRPR